MRPILILITVLLLAQTTVQATPTIGWTIMDGASDAPITVAKAGFFFIDHLVDAAACTLAGLMFRRTCKNVSTPKINQ